MGLQTSSPMASVHGISLKGSHIKSEFQTMYTRLCRWIEEHKQQQVKQHEILLKILNIVPLLQLFGVKQRALYSYRKCLQLVKYSGFDRSDDDTSRTRDRVLKRVPKEMSCYSRIKFEINPEEPNQIPREQTFTQRHKWRMECQFYFLLRRRKRNCFIASI